jgi:hypothetical protein
VSAFTLNAAVDNGSGLDGYFTFGGYVRDRSGNRTNFVARTVLIDATAPDTTTASLTMDTIANTAWVTGTGEDNVELVRARADLQYGAFGGSRFYVGTQTLGAAFANPGNGRGTRTLGSALRSVALNVTRFYRQVEQTNAADSSPQALPADPRPAQARIRFYDAADNSADATVAGTLATAIVRPFTTGGLAISRFYVSGTANTLEAFVSRNGLTNVQALVQRVDFYWFDTASGLWTYFGSNTVPFNRSEVLGNSIWRFAFAASGQQPTGAVSVRGVAVDAQGNGLLSPAITVTFP